MIKAVKHLTNDQATNLKYSVACMLQLAFKVDSPKSIPEVINFLDNNVIGLHLQLKGNDLISTKSPTNVKKLPSYVSSLSEAALYSYKNSPPSDGYLTSLSANDKIVCLSVPHAFGDGAYFRLLTDSLRHLRDPNSLGKRMTIDELPPFPQSNEALFSDKLRTAKDGPLLCDDPEVTRIIPNDKPQTGCFSSYYSYKLNSKELRTSINGKLHHFTEALWASMFISACAHNGKLNESAAVATCMNMRNFIPNNPNSTKDPFQEYSDDLAKLCVISSVTPKFDGVRRDMTIAELCAGIRKGFEEKVRKGAQYEFMRGHSVNHKILPGSPIEISSVGSLNVGGPIVDAYCSLHAGVSDQHTHITMTVFSTQNDNGNNDILYRIMYNPNVFGGREMDSFGQATKYFLKNIPFDRTVGDAYDELRSFYLSAYSK